MSEKELVANYGHKARVTQGKVVATANEDITPFEYGEIFPMPDDDFIASMHRDYGNGIPSGNQQEHDEEQQHVGGNSDIDEAWEDEVEDGAEEDSIPDHTGLGAVADEQGDDSDEAAQTLTELALANDIDPEDFDDWQGVEDAIENAINPPKPKPAAKKVAKKFAPAKKAVIVKQAPPKTGGINRPNRGAFGR